MEAKFARGPHRQVNDATAHEGSAISDGDDDTPAIAPSHSHLGTERERSVRAYQFMVTNGLPLAVLEPF